MHGVDGDEFEAKLDRIGNRRARKATGHSARSAGRREGWPNGSLRVAIVVSGVAMILKCFSFRIHSREIHWWPHSCFPVDARTMSQLLCGNDFVRKPHDI
ncbi:MAG TPA: hypothetical protein VMM15_23355 [Bradyrhizobium sp.]|nr:hypothetical protein [Bradyrhizobium sp.]